MDDVVIIGGSFAGLMAASHLVRARRRVTVLDTDLPRNRFAEAAHNVLGYDGVPPREIRRKALSDLLNYPTARHVQAEAVSAEGENDAFLVRTAAGDSFPARRLVLAYGVRDIFPSIDGFEACWGRTVIHCPYCHGYEAADGRIGLLYSSPNSLHAATLLADWSDRLTLLTNGLDLPADAEAKLRARGVELREGRVTAFLHDSGRLSAVRFEDGSEIALDAVLAHPQVEPTSSIHAQLGARTTESLLGPYLTIDDDFQTTVTGVFTAGDLAGPRHSINGAIYGGTIAGVGCHRSLLDGS